MNIQIVTNDAPTDSVLQFGTKDKPMYEIEETPKKKIKVENSMIS